MTPYLERGLEHQVERRLSADRIVVLEGARATGKTSLLERGRSKGWIREIRSFADPAERAAAEAAPRDYVASLPACMAIDEVQLFEEITVAIKERIDANPGPGQFLLTGSTRLRRNALGGSDPLAGRTGKPLVLGPLTMAERGGQPVHLLSQLFDANPIEIEVETPMPRSALISSLQQSGLPGLIDLTVEEQRGRLESYLTSVTNLQAFESRNVQNLTSLGRYLAGRTSTLVNVAEFATKIEIARSTADEYLAHLEEALLIHRLRAWRPTRDKAETAKPKIHFFDAGTACGLGRMNPAGSQEELGRLAETLVVTEMARQSMWFEHPPDLFHWRHRQRDEVDLVVESTDGQVVCIEVKSTEQVSLSDFRGIDAFRDRYPDRFHRGFVFYSGSQILPYGEDRWAIPFGALGAKPPEAEVDVVGAVLDDIATRRSSRVVELNQQDQLIDEVSSQLERFASSLGYDNRIEPSHRLGGSWQAKLFVVTAEGSRPFIMFDLDFQAEVLRLRLLQRKGKPVQEPISFIAQIDGRTGADLVAELLGAATEDIADSLTVWDAEAR